MFALQHWRHSPDVLDGPPAPPSEGLSLLQRVAYDKDRRAVDAVCFPACDWRALVSAFDATDELAVRRGIAAVLCRYMSVAGPVHETPEELLRWISSTLQKPDQDALVGVLLNACVPFFVPRVVQEPTSPGVDWAWAADAHSFAQQLAAFDERLVRRLHPDAPFGYTQDAAVWEADQFRLKLPNWVATQILQPPHSSKTILFFLRAARHLLALGSFNAFAVLMNGLTHPAVVRVAPAWAALWADFASAWEEMLKVRSRLSKLAFVYSAREGAVAPFVYAFQLAAVRDDERAPQIAISFLKVQTRCTFGFELFDTAKQHFSTLLPRLDDHGLGAASFDLYADPVSSSVTDTLRRWWSSTAPAPAPARPPIFLGPADWDAVFAKSQPLTFAPSAFADQSAPLSVYRVKRGRIGPHVEGEIFCDWSESLLCGDTGAELQVTRLTLMANEAVRLRALKAYCAARAHRDTEMAVAPPLLREPDYAARWTRLRVFRRGDIVLRAGQVVDGAYFGEAKCSLGCFVPHAKVRADVVALDDEVRVMYIPMAFLDASPRLSCIVFEHLAMQAYLAMGVE